MELAEIAELQRERDGLTAAAGPPLVPPRQWFEREEPDDGPVGWTVTADGEVFGHAAVWGTCHTGKPGKCITPPKSRSDYAYYQTGLTEVDDGELLPTGRITLGTGHASLTASPAATAEHYDNTGAVVADVTVRDGKHGIWVTGALRPGVTPERARELRGASLSGDWRSIRGALEMLGLLAVNVPGFPVPRGQALTADGRQELYADALQGNEELLALVGAGSFALVDEELAELPDPEDHELEAEFKALFGETMKASAPYVSKEQQVREALNATAAARLPVGLHVEMPYTADHMVEAYQRGKEEGVQELFEDEEELAELLADASPGRARMRKIAQVMKEFKAGTLKDGNGNKVTNRKQALAIALSQSKKLTAAGYADEKAELLDAGWEIVEETDGYCILRSPKGEEKRVEKDDDEEEAEVDEEEAEEEIKASAEECEECEPEPVEDFPGELLLAAAPTQQMRERLAQRGEALGNLVLRNRADIPAAVKAATTPEERQWIVLRASALDAIGDLPASWDIYPANWDDEEVVAAGRPFDESKHPRHAKGSEKGGEFAPKGTSKLAPRPDEAGAAAEHRRTRGGKLVRGPGGRMMSRTEKGVLLDKAEGRSSFRAPVSSMSPSSLPPELELDPNHPAFKELLDEATDRQRDIRGPEPDDYEGQARAADQSARANEARANELRAQGNAEHAADYDAAAKRARKRASDLRNRARVAARPKRDMFDVR